MGLRECASYYKNCYYTKDENEDKDDFYKRVMEEEDVKPPASEADGSCWSKLRALIGCYDACMKYPICCTLSLNNFKGLFSHLADIYTDWNYIKTVQIRSEAIQTTLWVVFWLPFTILGILCPYFVLEEFS